MTWKEPLRWKGMLSGEDCPFCKDMHLPENPFSHLIQELPHSFFRLTKAQDPRGLCSVALKTHATEVFQLDETTRNGFFRDISTAASAINAVFSPVKIHYGIFGSLCPHVHCHLMPKYFDDDPHAPVTFGDKSKIISSDEAIDLIRLIRGAINHIE